MSIKGKKRTEKEYRAIVMDSSSSLKEFSMDRKKYYKRYVLGEKTDDVDNQATLMGRLVETILLEPLEVENRFHLSACLSTPTGLMLAFVEALYKHTIENENLDFEEIARMAYADSGFKIKFEAVITKFVKSDVELYYKELLMVRRKGLSVITLNDLENAEKIVKELKTNFATQHIVNLENDKRYSVYNQFAVEGYKVEGHVFKSLFDKLVIDHKEETIQVYDLKCVWSVEGFYEDYYLYRRAYIQAYLYHKAAQHVVDMNEDLKDYSVLYPKFIVCDSINYMNPLVYTLDNSDYLKALEGFEHKGKIYPGVKDLIKDLDWAIVNDKWNISRKNFENGGKINIRG